MYSRAMFTLSAVLLTAAAGTARAELITVRSGQVGGVPGTVGQPDDTVRFLNNNPPGGPISAVPFTPADFNGALTGAPASVINPYIGAWTPGISDLDARWINFSADSLSGYGTPGSSLYAVPFFVTTAAATGGNLTIEFAVDDGGGDFNWGGPNPSFLYVNGTDTGYNGGNYAASTFHSQFVSLSSGWNTIYLYQRDQGVAVSGLIFSMTIEVVPEPGTLSLLGFGVLALVRRQRQA